MYAFELEDEFFGSLNQTMVAARVATIGTIFTIGSPNKEF